MAANAAKKKNRLARDTICALPLRIWRAHGYANPSSAEKARGQSLRRLRTARRGQAAGNSNVSETLERRLRNIVRAEQEKRWLEENRAALSSINAFIDSHGLLSSRLRYRADKKKKKKISTDDPAVRVVYKPRRVGGGVPSLSYQPAVRPDQCADLDRRRATGPAIPADDGAQNASIPFSPSTAASSGWQRMNCSRSTGGC